MDLWKSALVDSVVISRRENVETLEGIEVGRRADNELHVKMGFIPLLSSSLDLDLLVLDLEI